MAAAVREVGRQVGVSVSLPPNVGEDPVSVAFDDVDGEAALRRLGGELGLVPRLTGDNVSFVSAADSRERFAVLRSGFMDPLQAAESVRQVVGEGAKVENFGDSLLVVGTADAVERAERFAEQLKAGPDGWELEVRVVRVNESFRRELGVQWTVAGRAGAEFGAAGGTEFPGSVTTYIGLRAAATVEAVGRAIESGSGARLLTSAPLFVLEGGEGTLSQGDRVPVPRRVVSPQGTVSTEGYDYVDTGFQVTVKAKRVPGGVRLELAPSLSGVKGYVEEAPIVTRAEVRGSAVVKSGEWCILGGLDIQEASKGHSGLPGLSESAFFGLQTESAERSSILVMVRAVRIFAAGVDS